jgi:hypothetical protein
LRELTALSALALIAPPASAAPLFRGNAIGTSTNGLAAGGAQSAIVQRAVEHQRSVDAYSEAPDDAGGSGVIPLELDHDSVDDNGICLRVDPPVTKTGIPYRC